MGKQDGGHALVTLQASNPLASFAFSDVFGASFAMFHQRECSKLALNASHQLH